MAKAHAYLGVPQAHHVFKFNPSQVEWGYRQNVVSTDTIGGRVVQLLSVAVDGIQVQGVAGSRDELQRMAENVKSIMDYQIKTLRSVTFRVPSRRWDFKVYVTAMPQMGWDVASVTYPYQLQLEVVDDLTGIKLREIETLALDRLYAGIGYDPSFHGGDAKGFDKVVKTVLRASAQLPSGNDSTDNTDDGSYNSGASGAWGGYANGKIPYKAMTRIHAGCTGGVGCYLEPTAAAAFKAMERAFGKPIDGAHGLVCAYRSWDQQNELWVAGGSDGTTTSGLPVAKPGTSNHGLGKAIDVSTGSEAQIWLLHNASRFNWHPLSGDPPHFNFGR